MGTSLGLRRAFGCALVGMLALMTVACVDRDDRALKAARADRSRAVAAYRDLQAVRQRLRERNADLRRAVRRLEESSERLRRKFTRSLRGLRSQNRELLSQVRSLEATLNAVARSGYPRSAPR